MGVISKKGMVYAIRKDLDVSLTALARAASRVSGVNSNVIVSELDVEGFPPQTQMERLPVSFVQGIENLINDQSKVAHSSGSSQAARFKAVRCYMGFSFTDVSRLPGMDITRETVRLWDAGRVAINVTYLEAFAEATKLPILYLRTGLLFNIPPDHRLGRKIGAGANESATSLKVWQAINGCTEGSREEMFAAINADAVASTLSRECGGYWDGHKFCLWNVPTVAAPKVKPGYDSLIASKNFSYDLDFSKLMIEVTQDVIDGKLTMKEGRVKLNAYRAEKGEKPATFAALSNSVARAKARVERLKDDAKANAEKAKNFAMDPFTNAIWTFNN